MKRCHRGYGPVLRFRYVESWQACRLAAANAHRQCCWHTSCVVDVLRIEPPLFIQLFPYKRALRVLIGPEAQEVFSKAGRCAFRMKCTTPEPVFDPHVVYDATKKESVVQFQTMANGLRTNRLKSHVTKIEEETSAHTSKMNGRVNSRFCLPLCRNSPILTASRWLQAW
jgi:hypothetical protein